MTGFVLNASLRKRFVATVAVYQTLQYHAKAKGTPSQLMTGVLRRVAAQARDYGKPPVTKEFVLQELIVVTPVTAYP